jgi:Protein of unknown function (DUF3192)
MLPLWLCFLLGMGFLTGCSNEKVLVPRYSPTVWSNYFQLQGISPGMTKEEVVAKMGPPRVAEEGGRKGESFLFYQTHNMDKLGNETIRGGLTPLVFQDNRLAGIGRRSYNRAMGFPDREENSVSPPMSFPDRQDNTQPSSSSPWR